MAKYDALASGDWCVMMLDAQQIQPRLLRYAVLWHEGVDGAHFDILIERQPGAALAAWRSPAWPITALTPLVWLPDHRAIYLTYEGEISGGRGRVTRVAGGVAEVRQGDSWIVRFDDGSGIVLSDGHASPLSAAEGLGGG